MKFFLFHCWGGDGRSCWSGWLQDELKVSGFASSVISPDFPDTNEPRLEEWLSSIRHQVPKFDRKDEWVFIGHSLGCPTILRLLESFGPQEKSKAVILVAGFAKDLGIEPVKNFVEKEFDWEKIRSNAGAFTVINSDNDPFIGLSEGERIAKLLGANFIVEHGAGHINEGSGFKSYPRLMEIIKKLK
jgi:uncharacterized protein